MNRKLLGLLATAFAFSSTVSCSDKSASDVSGLVLNDSTVLEARVASATVTLAQSSLEVGQTTQATALLLDRQNQPLPLSVSWSSSDTSIARVSPNAGLVRAKSPGVVSIIATRGAKSGSATLTVTPSTAPPPVPVESVSVSPAASTLAIGSTVQLSVTAFDANNNVLTGRIVTSSSADPGIASVSSIGLVTAVSNGTTQITVSSEGKSAIATIIVDANAPPPPAPAPPPATKPGTVTDLQAAAIGSTSVTLSFTQVNDGTGQPAEYDVRYAVAPISWGSATYTTSGTCSEPVAGTATAGQFSCTVLGLTPMTNYNFQLIAFRGTLNLNAVFGSLSNIVAATTIGGSAPPPPPPPAPVASISVSPASSTLQIGATVQLLVTAFDAANNVLTGRIVTSSSANPGIASVNSLGLVTAVSAGTTQITVVSETKSAVATIIVSAAAPVPVASVSVSPATASLLIGATAQLAATTRDDGNNVLAGRVVTWSTASAAIATISSTGLVRAVSAGTTQITASSEGRTAGATITVSAPAPMPVASVSASPAASSLQAGATVQLTATTRDANNKVLTGRVISWSSNNSAVGTISASGLVRGIAAGNATITVTSETMTGTATVAVTDPPPPPPPSGGTGEPSGMTLISNRPFNALNELGWSDAGSNGSIVQDATAPGSPPNVLRMHMPAGFGEGGGPFSGNYTLPNKRTLYVRYSGMFSSNWQGSSSGVDKTFYVYTSTGVPSIYFNMDGSGVVAKHPQIAGQNIVNAGSPVVGGDRSNPDWTTNLVPGYSVPLGTWHTVEFVLVGNTAGNADGSIDWWVNGVHVGSYTGIQFISGNCVWNVFHYTLLYSGNTQSNPKSDQDVFFDNIYLSGK